MATAYRGSQSVITTLAPAVVSTLVCFSCTSAPTALDEPSNAPGGPNVNTMMPADPNTVSPVVRDDGSSPATNTTSGDANQAATTAPSQPPPPTEVLLEDFSDGDANLSAPGFQGIWQTYSDGTGQVTPPEESVIVPVAGAIDVTGTGFSDWGVGLTIDFNTDPSSPPDGAQRGVVDLSDYRGFSLSTAGSGVLAVELVIPATTGVEEGGNCTEGCFGHFSTTLTLSEDFGSQELQFGAFTQPEWAAPATLDLSQVIGLNFLARADGGAANIDLSIERLALLTNAPPPTVGGNAEPGSVVGDGSNPFLGRTLHTGADQAIGAYNSASGAERDLLAKVALNPTAFWLNGGDPSRAGGIVDAGGDNYAVLVAYNIPGRDCTGESAGGTGNSNDYRNWIDGMSQSLQGKSAAVVLEPDALALGCVPEAEELIAYSVASLRQNPGIAVYIDGGHSNWISAEEMAGRLANAGIAQATGFAVNVSNYRPTANLINYGKQLSGLVGGKPFIVDTSRNGQGALGSEWCNPAGRGLGEAPTTNTGDPDIHALLWIKRPGESDGACGQCGGVSAGQFCTAYALELAQNSVF